jgi:hypothetical protein
MELIISYPSVTKQLQGVQFNKKDLSPKTQVQYQGLGASLMNSILKRMALSRSVQPLYT